MPVKTRKKENNKMSKFQETNEKIAEKVVEGYKKVRKNTPRASSH